MSIKPLVGWVVCTEKGSIVSEHFSLKITANIYKDNLDEFFNKNKHFVRKAELRVIEEKEE